jgi:hypothetical protein
MTRARLWPVLAAAVAFGPLAAAQNGAPATVPVEGTSYHVPVFSNDFVTVLNVFIPPQRESGYHRHSLDSVGVLISDTPRTGQVLGAEATPTAQRGNGSANFTHYAREPVVHNVAITGDVPFHNIVVELLAAEPHGFTVGARGAGYTQVLDNERVRVWRLALAPGETAAAISQVGPGVRVVIEGGELAELEPGKAERRKAPHRGEFYWQEAGMTRAVRNIGTTRIDLIELEIK